MEPTFTTGQVAASLHISAAYVRKLTIMSGVDASHRTAGGQRRFTASDVERLRTVLEGKVSLQPAVSPSDRAVRSADISAVSAKMQFLRGLAIMYEARCPLTTSLMTLAHHGSSMDSVADKLRQDLECGLKLSQAMARLPDVFTQMEIAMVCTGEDTGQLDRSLLRLADYLEQERDDLEAQWRRSA